jgi:ketosteroid isomerase-like protein
MTGRSPLDTVREYFRRIDGGESPLELFADDVEIWFPKYGTARGKDEVLEMFGNVRLILDQIVHDRVDYLADGDTVVAYGTSSGATTSGRAWRSDDAYAGRFCNVATVRGGQITSMRIHLDPDYGGEDTARYPWLQSDG